MPAKKQDSKTSKSTSKDKAKSGAKGSKTPPAKGKKGK